MINNKKIAVIGLGYVGLPLAVEFGKNRNTVGFDINSKRIEELNSGIDSTLEVEAEILTSTLGNGLFSISNDLKDISDCNFFIITVPTPTDKFNRPVLDPLIKASRTVGSILKKGDIVVYESTVYPGVTEEECVPILENASGMRINQDFFVGYSPERINPGDKQHTLTKIIKVTSGSTDEAADIIDQIYKSIITAGTFRASCIKVAEAAKVIENSQRDLNIAFVNELSKIFNLIGIDTQEVLEAASTKWNFLNFKPGLVGGHCIGVDPYYLAQKAQEVGYHPEMILAGRRLNDSMGIHVSNEVIKLMIKKRINVECSRILILGFTFKENCPDIRNTKVIDIYNELISYDIKVDIFDPWANSVEVYNEYGISVFNTIDEKNILQTYSVIILAVAHEAFKEMNLCTTKKHVIFDVKGLIDIKKIDARL
jgi:UDP-N-acetyl-D-galactosamine dehydrogenase